MPAATCITAWEFSRCSAGTDGKVRTPFGVFGDTLFLAGTLTEKIQHHGKTTSLRVSDPTGVFTLTLSPQNSAVIQQAETIDVPSFVAVTGTIHHRAYAETSLSEIIPDILTPCDRTIRDAWLCSAASDALARLETLPATTDRHEFAAALARALEHVRDTVPAETAAAVPAAPAPAIADDQLLAIIIELSGKKGAPIADVLTRAGTCGMGENEAKVALARLMEEGECYTPTTELIKVA